MSVTKVPANVLSPTHFQTLQNTIARVLEATVARQAYAQILDGAPNYNNHHCNAGRQNCHEATSDAAFRVWDGFRVQFSLELLSFRSSVIQGYQNAVFGSQEFIVHLLELVVIACHDVAIHLYNVSEGGLRPKPLTTDPYFDNNPMFFQPPLPSTAFSYDGYTNVDEYPQGVAECVGYWVEFEIFGGVVVFDRGQSGTECKSAFIHPGGDYMIAELSSNQLLEFLAFGQGNSTKSPLPWKGETWARRVDPYESFKLNIFRDRYERRPPGRRTRDVFRLEDFPDLMESSEALNRAEREKRRDGCK